MSNNKYSFLIKLTVLYLGFSLLLSSIAAVPTSRSLKSSVALQDLQPQILGGEEIVMVEGLVERRMDLESTDYPGTGANNHHDPKTPGTA